MWHTYGKRIFFCACSLILFAFGNFLGVKAGSAGTNAWNTLALGISAAVDCSFGMANLSISLVIIVIDLLGRGKLGVGSVLNVLLIPIFSDWFLAVLQWIPEASGPLTGAAYTLIGQTVISFATILYMRPGLGCGPRDTLMVLIGQRLSRAPIGVVKFLLETAALLAGFLMGAPFGLGTILVMLLQASIFQAVCQITHYEPRTVVHEDLAGTWRTLTGK